MVLPGDELVLDVRLLLIEPLLVVERLLVIVLPDVVDPELLEFIEPLFDIEPLLVVELFDIELFDIELFDIVLLLPDVLFIVELLLLLEVLLLPVSDEQLPPTAAIVNTIDNVNVLLIENFSFFY